MIEDAIAAFELSASGTGRLAATRTFGQDFEARVIARGGEVMVRDLNSTLGTLVNDRPLGRDFPVDSVPLRKGPNTLVAGGKGSPFVFTVTLS